jgi:hypothetical protein
MGNFRFFYDLPHQIDNTTPTGSEHNLLIPIIVSNCVPPLGIPTGKQAVFHKMDAQFKTRIRIKSWQLRKEGK